jgi:hypothetical protein
MDRATYFQARDRERSADYGNNSAVPCFWRIELSPPDTRRFTVKWHSVAQFRLGGLTPSIKTKEVGHRT